MTETSYAAHEPSPRAALLARQRGTMALAGLVRSLYARAWGVRLGRALGLLIAGVTAGALLVMRDGRTEPNAPAAGLIARTAITVCWLAGGVAALALAVPPRDQAATNAVFALSRARGISDRAGWRAEFLASTRILAEVVALPIALLALLAAFDPSTRAPAASFARIVGAVAFALLAAVLLGAVVSGCRFGAGLAGRRWLVGAILVPWIAAQALFSETLGDWLSIPGLLHTLWQALTASRS